MIISKQLEKEIAQSFNLKKGRSENESSWIKRIIYSLIARNAYASLWDIQEDDPSITHFKNRATEVYKALKSIYPEYLNMLNEIDVQSLLEYTYQLYLKSGQFYHSPNRIKYSKKLITQFDGVSLGRSPYLRLNSPFSKGYWKYVPDTDGRISLLKIGYPGSELYYFYEYDGEKLMTRKIPDWRVKNKGYLDIACAILHHNKTLLPILYEVDGELVHIKLQYLLPPKLQLFFELYSWPYSFVGNSKFNRVMNIGVFNIFKSLLEELEFEFKEGK